MAGDISSSLTKPTDSQKSKSHNASHRKLFTILIRRLLSASTTQQKGLTDFQEEVTGILRGLKHPILYELSVKEKMLLNASLARTCLPKAPLRPFISIGTSESKILASRRWRFLLRYSDATASPERLTTSLLLFNVALRLVPA